MSEPKHILFLTWKDIRHPFAGWAEQVMYEYARWFVAKGYRVTWFASSATGLPSQDIIDGIHIVRKYTRHTAWLMTWWWYRGFSKKETVDLIVDEAGGWPMMAPRFEKKIPIIFFTHHIGDAEFDTYPRIIGQIAKWIYRWLFQCYIATPAIAVSESTKQELVERFGYQASNITVITNSTHIVPIKKINWTKKTNNLLFLGRLTAVKRTEDTIRAFFYALDAIPSDVQLSIIGNSRDIDYVKQLTDLAEELEISERITFYGYIPRQDFESIITTHRTMLIPSQKEGFGLVVLEANAYGLPVIAYDVAGLKDSVIPGVNGVLVPDGDYRAMGKEIIRIFEHPEAHKKLAESSLEHIKHINTWEKNIDDFEAIILSQIAKRNR